jgi:CBS domain-containing protein
MQISELMTKPVELIDPASTIEDAAKAMKTLDLGVLPVSDGDRLVGMVTDRDIAIRGIAAGCGPATAVREVMSREVRFCFEDEDSAHVAKNMAELQVRRLPVLNRDKRLVGIVSLGDLATAAAPEHTAAALQGIAQPGGSHNQSGA